MTQEKYIIVRQYKVVEEGKKQIIRTFKVTNPKKIKFWKFMAKKVSPEALQYKTEIIEEK